MISDTALSVLGSLLSCSGHSISKALLTVSLFIQFLSPFVQYSMLKYSRPGQFLGMPFSSSNLKYNPASAFITLIKTECKSVCFTSIDVTHGIESLGAVCNVVRFAGEALGSARAALVVSTHKLAEVVRCRDRAVAAVGTGVVHPDPVHGAAALGEPVHGGHPLGVRQVALRVPYQAAGAVVLRLDEPVGLPDNILIVSVVEEVATPNRPGVLVQRVGLMHPSQGVRSHDGCCLPAAETELVPEEV